MTKNNSQFHGLSCKERYECSSKAQVVKHLKDEKAFVQRAANHASHIYVTKTNGHLPSYIFDTISQKAPKIPLNQRITIIEPPQPARLQLLQANQDLMEILKKNIPALDETEGSLYRIQISTDLLGKLVGDPKAGGLPTEKFSDMHLVKGWKQADNIKLSSDSIELVHTAALNHGPASGGWTIYPMAAILEGAWSEVAQTIASKYDPNNKKSPETRHTDAATVAASITSHGIYAYANGPHIRATPASDEQRSKIHDMFYGASAPYATYVNYIVDDIRRTAWMRRKKRTL
jgi:hypothetical protein